MTATVKRKKARAFELRGGNAAFFESREPEVLLSGPAGTGKSLTALVKIDTLATRFPGSRHLIVRKTRSSLTESGLNTLERDVLGFSHPMLLRRPTLRRMRQSYKYANGSEVVIGGMDKPEKTLSTEFDSIFIQEATELELPEYEVLLRALRNGRIVIDGEPFHQLMCDANPTYPHHFLRQRFTAGPLVNYPTRHEDNPRFFSRETNDWTPAGRAYLATLEHLTGHRRQRFLLGVWACAEGLVFDTFGSHNLLPKGWTPPKEWPRYHSVDFGFTNPLCYQFWARDGDGRLYLYREIYKTQYLVEDLAKFVKAEVDAGTEPRPVAVIADPEDAEGRATFTKHSGLSTVVPDKTKKQAGIQAASKRFEVHGDGKPRLFIVEGACANPDRRLSEAGKPTCTQDELSAYVWHPDGKDEPIKEDDHGCDALRYLVFHLDGKPEYKGIWDAPSAAADAVAKSVADRFGWTSRPSLGWR